MGYVGAANLEALRENAQFVRMSGMAYANLTTRRPNHQRSTKLLRRILKQRCEGCLDMVRVLTNTAKIG